MMMMMMMIINTLIPGPRQEQAEWCNLCIQDSQQHHYRHERWFHADDDDAEDSDDDYDDGSCWEWGYNEEYEWISNNTASPWHPLESPRCTLKLFQRDVFATRPAPSGRGAI